jgi:hypothetical protein
LPWNTGSGAMNALEHCHDADSSLGTNFAATHRMFKSARQMSCAESLLVPTSSAISRTVPGFFSCASAAQRGLWPPNSRGFLITHNHAPQSVGLPWSSDQLFAEISTWKHTTNNTQTSVPPVGFFFSNPRSQQASGRRPTP